MGTKRVRSGLDSSEIVPDGIILGVRRRRSKQRPYDEGQFSGNRDSIESSAQSI
jgi:hypothetical protein